MVRGQLTPDPQVKGRFREASLLKVQGQDLFPPSLILECVGERKR